eukprot:6200094-Pleurochrysis_carterae.AAC.1
MVRKREMRRLCLMVAAMKMALVSRVLQRSSSVVARPALEWCNRAQASYDPQALRLKREQ